MGYIQVTKWRKTLIGSRRKQVIAAAAVALLVGGGITTSALVSSHQAEQAEAREVAAALKAENKRDAAEKERVAAERQQEADDLAEAISDGAAALEDADATTVSAAAYAEAELLVALAAAREELDRVVSSGSDRFAINTAKTAVRAAIQTIGSKDQADDRKYVAMEIANGGSIESGYEDVSIRIARDYCASLSEHYDSSVPTDAVSRLLEEGSFSRDDNAIIVYCPAFLPSLKLAQTGLWDGYHIVADAFGVDGQGRDTIKAGTYRTVGGVSNCYWEINSGSGGTLDNDFISNAHNPVTVTVRSGQGFETDDCGAWLLVG